jgi:hypothetical protein
MEQKTVAIDLQLAQAILSYLQTRPYAEVYQLIELLIRAAQTGSSEQPAIADE